MHARIAALHPGFVINTAAYNLVDDAESRPDLAFAVNASGVAFVARAAAQAGARLAHISTDYVFAGQEPAAGVPVPYREEDRPAPRSVYGVSKLAGEHLARAYAPGALVIRTCGIYGPRHNRSGKRSFVEAILHQAQSGNASGDSGGRPILRVVSDQRVCPTYAADLARAILQLLRTDAQGVVHVASAGSCSWYEFAVAILELAGLDADVLPIPSTARASGAARPAYSVLDLGRLQQLGVTMPHWREALRRYLQERAAAAPA